MPRKYTKKSEYWSNLSKSQISNFSTAVPLAEADLNYSFDDRPHYSEASCTDSYSRQYRNIGNNQSVSEVNKYSNINNFDIPFTLESGNYSVSNVLNVIYKAYFGVQILRNYINMMADFSKSKLHVESDNKSVKSFFENWLDVIRIDELMAEYFIEYYRSGNVFLYKFNGKIKDRDFETLKASFGSKKDTLPIKYILLNPMQVQLQYGSELNSWLKVLSKYELARLKNPKTPEDQKARQQFAKLFKLISAVRCSYT